VGYAIRRQVIRLVVVGHDMHFVESIGQKITCCTKGGFWRKGPRRGAKDPRVVDVYLGR